MSDQRRHDPLGLAALLDHGTDAAPGLDGACVLVAARSRRARRRGVAALTAGVAAAGVAAVLLTGTGPLTTAPAPPAGSTAPTSTTTGAPPTTSASTPPTWDGTGERFALIDGSTCNGLEGVQPQTEVLCFDVLDRAATDPLGPRLHCSTGPAAVGPTPGVVPNRTLGDGVEVEVRTEHDLVQGLVGDRFFVVYGANGSDEGATEAAIRLCRAAPPLEQVLAYTVVHPGPAVAPDDDDLELVRRLVAYAGSPSVGLAADVPFADRVQVGQVGRVVDVAPWPCWTGRGRWSARRGPRWSRCRCSTCSPGWRWPASPPPGGTARAACSTCAKGRYRAAGATWAASPVGWGPLSSRSSPPRRTRRRASSGSPSPSTPPRRAGACTASRSKRYEL